MNFSIIYGGTIEVFKNEDIFLKANVNNRIKTHLNFFKGNKSILESTLFSFFTWRKVKLTYQNLPHPIDRIFQMGVLKFGLTFNNHFIICSQKPFQKTLCLLYLDDTEIASIQSSTKPTMGYSRYTMISQSDDDEINLYLLLCFLLPYTPT